MKKDITQVLFDDTIELCKTQAADVYDRLPETVPYPFVYVGEVDTQPTDTKDLFVSAGTAQVTVHVYGEADKRRRVTDLLRALKMSFVTMRGPDYQVTGQPKLNTLQEKPNDTETLLHGVLTVEFSYVRDEREGE